VKCDPAGDRRGEGEGHREGEGEGDDMKRTHRSPSAPSPRAARRTGVRSVAEALGYLGGMLATIGLVLAVAQYWPDLALAGRLGISAAGAVVLLVAGWLVPEHAEPALARLRWFLWLASTASPPPPGRLPLSSGQPSPRTGRRSVCRSALRPRSDCPPSPQSRPLRSSAPTASWSASSGDSRSWSQSPARSATSPVMRVWSPA
jgi:hypothetical protein